METDQKLPTKYADKTELTIPEFGSIPAIPLDVSDIKEGESRLHESRVVHGGTYNDLEYVYNEGYRQAKTHLSVIGYQITLAKKALRTAKSKYILDEYPEFLKEKKLKDNATVRDAYMETKEEYVSAQDRIDMLTALESLFEGKIKNFEIVCRYMRKQIDIMNRSGIDPNKYMR